jgi:hypothetical protein
LFEDNKAAVAAVACEFDNHGWQAYCERQASGELDVYSKQENQCRNKQFSKQRGDNAGCLHQQ